MNKVKYLREVHGLTKTDLAEKVGVSRSAITRYESGERRLNAEVALRLASFFGVSVAYIIGDSDVDSAIDESFSTLEALYNRHEERASSSSKMLVELIGICKDLDENEINKIIDYAKLISAAHDFGGVK